MGPFDIDAIARRNLISTLARNWRRLYLARGDGALGAAKRNPSGTRLRHESDHAAGRRYHAFTDRTEFARASRDIHQPAVRVQVPFLVIVLPAAGAQVICFVMLSSTELAAVTLASDFRFCL